MKVLYGYCNRCILEEDEVRGSCLFYRNQHRRILCNFNTSLTNGLERLSECIFLSRRIPTSSNNILFQETETVGYVGLLIVVAGMAGSVVGGFILDKFKKFKLTTIMIYLFSFVGMLSFTLTIDLDSMVLVFINAALLG